MRYFKRFCPYGGAIVPKIMEQFICVALVRNTTVPNVIHIDCICVTPPALSDWPQCRGWPLSARTLTNQQVQQQLSHVY